MELDQNLGQKLMLAFVGHEDIPEEMKKTIRELRPAGFTLFRANNIDSPQQLRHLTEHLQKEAEVVGLPPFLIGTDQEGGQLMAIGEGTPLPGNMALGATGSEDLAYQAGQVLGRELSALGLNLDYAPCADVNINPRNPVVGVRSFGEDPAEVARLTAAMIRGIQSEGVAATAKHFPGHGDVAVDSHVNMPVVDQSLDQIRKAALPPFEAAIASDCKVIMTAHLGLPQIETNRTLPATLSKTIMTDLLRHTLGFEGVIITDAMDMHAILQGEALVDQTALAVAAGADLLLMTANAEDHQRAARGMQKALSEGMVSREEVLQSIQRVLNLKFWARNHARRYGLEVLNCEQHRKIADEIADRSITLVKDHKRLLPLRLQPEDKVAVIVPQPENLTPADTSSYIIPQLAGELHKIHANTVQHLIPLDPPQEIIEQLIKEVDDVDVVVIGTINAANSAGQVALVDALQASGKKLIVVAMRLPYDLAAFPQVDCYMCTYGILEPSMRAAARALFGQIPFQGKLPVTLTGTEG
ncbi:MAG: glycoside hydrolase family 3 N-terminal domain-containing protein [Anaerolineaceae bacterium]|nr:glycoside hydrolase family 3 N-terminal domain-containing protein [Anaerolineaceae bacterium]